MMNRSWVFPQWVKTRLDNFKDKEVISGYQLLVDDLAFKIGIALIDEWCLDERGSHWRETESRELVDQSPGGVPAAHHLFGQLHRWNVDHAFPGCLQNIERVVPVADHATHDRRFKIHHGVPRHGHNVCPVFVGGGDQYNRPQLQQAIDLGQGKGFFAISASPLWRVLIIAFVFPE